MRCPKCKSIEDRVIDSRPVDNSAGIRRRRMCLACEYRFTTYEQIERADFLVIKRDGRHELFDRQKLFGGIAKACQKRPIGVDSLDSIVEDIIQDLGEIYAREVPSKEIGAKVMEKLSAIDDVAYVRYVSVYRQFQDIGEFIDEIKKLEKRPSQPAKAKGHQRDLFDQ